MCLPSLVKTEYSQQAATSYRVQVTGPAHSEFLQRAYVLNEIGTLKCQDGGDCYKARSQDGSRQDDVRMAATPTNCRARMEPG